jgi:hypothetical protein
MNSAQEGIERSSANAERKNPGWNDDAYQYVVDYPEKQFMTEDVRFHAEECGLPIPPSKRAWGAVMVRARKDGIIQSLGVKRKPSDSSHGTPAVLWEKVS